MFNMDIIIEALTDTGRLVPLLAAIYFLVGFLEYRYGDRMSHFVTRIGAYGPVVGALFGCLPQCGFSVIAAALYVKRLVSLGTLLAIFLSTSDEAVPVLLAMPERASMVGLLIVIKVIVAVIAGAAVDFFLRRNSQPGRFYGASGDKHDYEQIAASHEGCCFHALSDKPSSKAAALILHPLLHTVKIFVFLFILTTGLNAVIAAIGEGRLTEFLLSGTALQPVLASFIGLIPNCFASVLLADLYARGAISFGSMVAGLSAGAGLGLLVLFKENKKLNDTLKVVALLLAISIFTGLLIQWFSPAI